MTVSPIWAGTYQAQILSGVKAHSTSAKLVFYHKKALIFANRMSLKYLKENPIFYEISLYGENLESNNVFNMLVHLDIKFHNCEKPNEMVPKVKTPAPSRNFSLSLRVN